MRRAITAISYMFFGASILVFISALLIPLLKQPSSQKESDPPTSHVGTVSEPPGPASTSQPEEVEPASVESGSAPAAQPQNSTSPTNQSEALTEEVKSEPIQTVEAAKPNQSGALPNEIEKSTESAQTSGTSSQAPASETGSNKAEQPKGETDVAAPAPSGTTLSEIKEAMSGAETGADASESGPTSLLVLGDGYFSPGEISPNAKAQEAIDKIIPQIKASPSDNIIVEGHADNLMSDRYNPKEASRLNKTVSLRRAIAVAMMLEQKGVNSDKIIVSGLGDTVPMASNLTEEGRAKNRRVEIKLSPAQ